MDPLTFAGAVFTWALWVAIEEVLENATDAAWTGAAGQLKARFLRWAGKDKESQRRAAFAKAAEIARTNTLRYAANPQQAEIILDVLNGERDRRGAEVLAEEAAKLMLFSAAPDVPRLTDLCHRTLRFEALFVEETLPPPETVAVVLSDFLTNLREAMLDQEPYYDLIQREMLRTLRQIAAPSVAYADEATYRYQMAKMYRQLEFVGIPELKERRPIAVEDIFIHLRAEREAKVHESPTEIPEEVLIQWRREPEQLSRREPRELEEIELRKVRGLREFRPRLVSERVDVDDALRQTKRLVVLGDPGAGKTTLLKYLTVICAEGRAETELGLRADGPGSPVPIFVPLREFAAECLEREQDYCLLDYLYTHACEHLLLNLRENFFEDALKAGHCLVCLDGLDEVWAVGRRKTVRDTVKALVTRFPRNRYLVTSRIVGYEEAPLDRRDFAHHTILSLEDDDIREFVRKWYEVRERDPVQCKQRADDLIGTIEREPRIKTLAQNPLLLTIIALVHRIEAGLPHERVKLYDKCVTALVDTWEEVKGLTIAEKQRDFYRYRRRLLERLAYELHTRAKEPGQLQTVKEGDLELLLTCFLMENHRLGLVDDPDGARDEARAFVRLARGRTGLLVERGEGVFGFSHLTFQEYLAACDIEKRCIHRGVDTIWEEIQGRLHEPHWREVILLLLGSLSKYDEPPTLLLEHVLEAGGHDEYESVLHRNLYLAARALADRMDVADDLHRRVVAAMLEIACTAPWWEQRDAFTTLSWLKQDVYAAEGLLAMAQDPQVKAWVRRDAAFALGQLGQDETAMEILLALARDPKVHEWVRPTAASALGQLDHADERVLDSLLALARDPSVLISVRRAAVTALGQLRRAEEEKVLDSLLDLACDRQVATRVRRDAVAALKQLGLAEEKVLDGLLVLVQDPQVHESVRSAAVSALGELGCTEEKVLDSLLALAQGPKVHEWLRRAAGSALGQLGHTEEAGEILLALARDRRVHCEVRSDAASALGHLGQVEEKVMDGLLAMAHDDKVYPSVRTIAVTALGQLGRIEETREILLVLVRDLRVDYKVRAAATAALGQLCRGEEKALGSLLALACNFRVHDEVRRAAAFALGQLDRAEEKVVEGLLTLAGDSKITPSLRTVVATALGQLGRTEEAGETLLALAQNGQVHYLDRSAAASALGQLDRAEEKVVDGLLALVWDEHVEAKVRHAAYESLKRLKGM